MISITEYANAKSVYENFISHHRTRLSEMDNIEEVAKEEPNSLSNLDIWADEIGH